MTLAPEPKFCFGHYQDNWYNLNKICVFDNSIAFMLVSSI